MTLHGFTFSQKISLSSRLVLLSAAKMDGGWPFPVLRLDNGWDKGCVNIHASSSGSYTFVSGDDRNGLTPMD